MREPIEVKVDHELLERLAKQHECPVWVSKNGDLHPLKTMDARHMQNTYLLLCQSYDEHAYAYSMIYSSLWGPDPDSMAYYYAEQEADNWYETHGFALQNWISAFQVWMNQRGIPIPEKRKIQKMPEVESIEVYGSARIMKLKKPEE